MTERTKKFAEELDDLILTGDLLLMSMQNECAPAAFREAYQEKHPVEEDEWEEVLKNLPDFRRDYQAWYSKAHSVIGQLLPHRLADFVSYFEVPKGRKSVDFQNYVVRDDLQGLTITSWGGETVVDPSAAIPEFKQQLNLVKAAKEALDSTLLDIRGVLQADLFDSEIETAAALGKSGYLRAAGAICGVVIEKHLHHVCEIHKVTVRKKNPGISELNQLLKDASIISIPRWRFVQHLADIRNICDHAKGREPTREEIEDLITGTEKVLKTIF